MFCDHIDNLDTCLLPQALREHVALLKPFATRAPGRYPIDDDRCFVMVQTLETVPAGQQHFEAHARYLDIQYLVEGAEGIGFLPSGSPMTLLEDKLEERDIAMYAHRQPGSELVLTPGMYAIFLPGEYHRPLCAVTQPMPIKKVVLKWRMGEPA
jgi:biofilm protein TabA